MLTCLQQPERHQVSVRGQDGQEDQGPSHKHAEGGEHTVDWLYPISLSIVHGVCAAAAIHSVQANVPAQILLATSKDQYRKPERGMWDYFIQHGNEGKQPGSTT